MLPEELRERARSALEHAERFQPVRSEVLLRLWRYPAFGKWRSWTVFSPEADTFGVREVGWDQPRQTSRLIGPLHGLRELGQPLPLFRTRDFTVPTTTLDRLLTRAPELLPPTSAESPPGLDGEVAGVAVLLGGREERAEWWHGGPAEWRVLVEWTDQLWEALREPDSG